MALLNGMADLDKKINASFVQGCIIDEDTDRIRRVRISLKTRNETTLWLLQASKICTKRFWGRSADQSIHDGSYVSGDSVIYLCSAGAQSVGTVLGNGGRCKEPGRSQLNPTLPHLNQLLHPEISSGY